MSSLRHIVLGQVQYYRSHNPSVRANFVTKPSYLLHRRTTFSTAPSAKNITTPLKQITFQKDPTINDNSLRALFLTSNNPYKVDEYKSALADTYGVRISTQLIPANLQGASSTSRADGQPIDDTNNSMIQKILIETAPSPNFILLEKTELRDAATLNPIESQQVAMKRLNAVVNLATLQVWKPAWNEDGTLKQITYQEYKHSVNGYVDTERAPDGNGKGFGWDAFFVNSTTGQTYAQGFSQWGKMSARQLVLDDFITGYLLYRTPQDLKNFPFGPTQAIDFDISVCHFILGNIYLSNSKIGLWGMDNVLAHQLNRGLFFKAATSRVLKNYFSPPFAGIPFTAKKSGPEETVYMVHDICHHNVPDLIYDGNNSPAHKHVYAAWRMMSEAMTMIMADMLYADSLIKTGVDIKQVDTRIYPLFQALNLPEVKEENKFEIIVSLLKANTAYAIMGDDSLWKAMLKPGQEEKLEAFKNHFSKFFIGDHTWTHANYENMAKMSGHYKTWITMVGREQFERAGVTLLTEMVGRVGKRGCNLNNFSDVVQHTFDEIIETCIKPVFTKPEQRISDEKRISNAFYRYMIGQTSFYAKYKDLDGMQERGAVLIKRLAETKHFNSSRRQELRDQYKKDVYYAWGKQVITTAMVTNICQLHPIFPPVYISYARPAYSSIAEAQEKLYGKSSSPTVEIAQQTSLQDSKDEKTPQTQHEKYVRIIDGITFIDALALENSIDKSIPAKDRLRQKMINAGVEFWDDEKTIVKQPIIGISAIGGFSVSLDKGLPSGMIYLHMGENKVGPLTPTQLADGLRDTMGFQSTHTNMNPNKKTARELYDVTIRLGHLSITHSAYIGVYALGISKKAELEFDVKRDLIHLARETSARTAAQDEPTLVAMTAEGAVVSAAVRKSTLEILAGFKRNDKPTQDLREEQNSLFPLSGTVSLGLNGTVRNFGKMMADINDKGKELEYRNILALLNDSLHGLLPEVFPSTEKTYDYAYPSHWKKKSSHSLILAAMVLTGSIAVAMSSDDDEEKREQKRKPKQAILLLGAPGVGKSTQTERIVKQLSGVMCVSTGALVRQLDKKVQDNLQLTDIEKKAAASLDRMRKGELMDDEAVYNLMMAHLSPGGAGFEEYFRSHTIILDGVVKASSNIGAFEAALQRFNTQVASPMSLNKVINITASDDELMKRQQTRVAKANADRTQQRPDDDVSVYRNRLNVYNVNAAKVIDYYKTHNNFLSVDSSQGIEQTNQILINAIKGSNNSNPSISPSSNVFFQQAAPKASQASTPALQSRRDAQL